MPSIPYNPPGVTVTELTSPSVNTSLSSTNTVCLVGPVQGYQVETQQIVTVSGATPFNVVCLVSGEQFANSGNAVFTSVTNAVNPSYGSAPNQGGYLAGTDYLVSINAANNIATVTPSGLMENGGYINFTYSVIPQNYYYATSFGSQSAIEQTYGPAFSPVGIQTPTSAAAAAVIENGQVPLIIQPLFTLLNPANPSSQRLQPTAAQITQASTWQQTLYALRAVQGINYIVPVVGQSFYGGSDSAQLAIFEALQDHIYYMETQSQPNEYIFGFMGEDSTTNSTFATDATLQTHATTLAQRYSNAVSQNLVLLCPSSFNRASPSNSSSTAPLPVGGEYLAAGYAGFVASSSVTGPLTRQTIANILQVNSYRDTPTKNADAQAGLTVLQQNGQTVQIRHAITLDNTSIENRELSVVRAKFFMISSLISGLNNSIIGQVPADGNATMLVTLTVTSILNQLQAAGAIVSYSNVQTRLLANDPTTCEIRFSWQPPFPLNNIDVIFSLDLTGATGSTLTTSSVVSS